MSFLNGLTATATINGTELAVTGWSVNDSAVILRYVNSKTGIHPVKESTIEDATFSITVDFDPSLQPFAAPLNIRAGTVLTAVKLFLDGPTGTTYWSFPSAIVASVGNSVVREGKVSTVLNCEASGQLAAPGGSLS